MAYFDSNATTPLTLPARKRWAELSEYFWHNPSSPYRASARARNLLEDARERLARRLGGEAEYIVFTGSATEANHMLLQYLAGSLPSDKRILVSPFEHSSVWQAAHAFWGERLELGAADDCGQPDLEALELRLASGDIAAVAWMAANNESGAVYPWEGLARLCKKYGVLYFSDASQHMGKLPDGDWSLCDAVSLCAHKFGGPKGVGALRINDRLAGFRSFLGGGQEKGRRAGTENLPSIGAMMAALEDPSLGNWVEQARYRDAFEQRMREELPGVRVVGADGPRLPNTSYIIVPKGDKMRWVRFLDKLDFQVSVGSACSTGKVSGSRVLQAMGYEDEASQRSLRISSSHSSTEVEWQSLTDAFLNVWDEISRPDTDDGLTEVISI